MATVITNTGLNVITKSLTGTATTLGVVAYGLGYTAASVVDTALGSFVGTVPGGGISVTQSSVNVSSDTLQVVAVLTGTGTTVNINEVGLFDSTGNLVLKNVLQTSTTPAIRALLTTADNITFTIKITFS